MPVKHGTQLVRDYNQKMIYNLIHIHKTLSRTDLVRLTKMSPASVSKMVGALLEEGLIFERSAPEGNVGRKPMLLSINPEGILVIGINVDVRRIAAGLVSADGRIIIYEEEANNVNCELRELPRRLAALTQRIQSQMTPAQKKALVGAGVTIPGVVSYPEGRICFSPQFRWSDHLFRPELEQEMGMQVLVDNNVKAVALAQQLFGAAQNVSDFVVVQIGSGIGGAVVTGGKLYRGENNMTGEFGHILIRPDGPLCDCGRKGCLQSYTCISGIENLAGREIGKVFEDARNGDARCRQILEDAETYLSIWLANLKNFYNPGMLILYGELLEAWPQLRERICARMEKAAWLPGKTRLKTLLPQTNERELTVTSSAAILLTEMLKSEIVIYDTVLERST